MAIPPQDDPWSVVDMINQSPPVDCTRPYDTSTLAGKTILITGGASGFGAAFARHWARYGAHLIIGDVNDAAGEALVAELRSSSSTPGQLVLYQHCDVTSWTDQLALFRAAHASSPTGGIDTVVAGAGIVEKGDPLNPSAAGVFDLPHNLDSDSPAPPPPPPLNVLAVNLTGVMYTTHLALYYLALNGPPPSTTTTTTTAAPRPTSSAAHHHHPGQHTAGGPRDRHILLISSIAGLCPLPGQTEYTASKHAVMGLFRALRGTAWARAGVRVNALAPYFVDTPLLPRAGLALLAGAPRAELADVVDAATRLVADHAVRGRALLVGPRVRVRVGGGGGSGGGGSGGGGGGGGGDGGAENGGGDGSGADEGGVGEGKGAVGGVKLLEAAVVGAEEGFSERRQGEQELAVWEVYGHDYERVEVFVWRYLALLNLMRKMRGWVGVVKDLWRIYVTGRTRR